LKAIDRRWLPTLRWIALVLILTASCTTHDTQQLKTTASPTAPLDRTLATKIDTMLEHAMQAGQVPGLAIGIIQNKHIVYAKGFGVAEIGSVQAVTSQTAFQLGSDSKMMVGIAMMQLVEQGKIDLDAPVTRYLPYFRLADPRYKAITLRHILSHRSGLPWCADYDRCDFLDYEAPEFDEGSLERHVRELVTVKLENPPGEKMQYSDVGFEILGDVIAKVSGQSFEDYIHDHIFAPMQLHHTSFKLKDIATDILASPHVIDPGANKVKVNSYYPYSRLHAPSSHLLSNVDDMNRYALVQLDQGITPQSRVLPASAYKIMWTPEIPTNMQSKWEKNLGLGWFLGDHDGHRLVGHGGGDTGFACGFIMAPEDGIAVVVMENREDSAEDIAFEVMALLLKAERDQPTAPAMH
jgi:CubicO group peptidase (beta-lactamase class C family)